jgi:hypothetical protein
MRAWELLVENKRIVTEAMAMREYAHPEEYLIRDGVDAGIEILQELKDDLAQPETLNVKWDGKAAIFWGRDEAGQFYMVPMNQWNKGQKLVKMNSAEKLKRLAANYLHRVMKNLQPLEHRWQLTTALNGTC